MNNIILYRVQTGRLYIIPRNRGQSNSNNSCWFCVQYCIPNYWSSSGSGGTVPHTESEGSLSGPSSPSPPPLPPPVTYEEVGVATEVKSSQDIQLTSNEAYGPTLQDNIPTSHNTAYGQVQL